MPSSAPAPPYPEATVERRPNREVETGRRVPVTGEEEEEGELGPPSAVPCAKMDLLPTDSLPDQVMNATRPKETGTVVCYSPMIITTNGIWQGVNPLEFSLPLFILQVSVIVVTTRFLVILLKPFRQPRVIAEILVRPLFSFQVLDNLLQYS
jgi:hypothetical protein